MLHKANLILLLFIMFLGINKITSQSQTYGSLSFSKAVNISGKQRMLSQKMSKSYLLLSKGIVDNNIKTELSSSKFIFARQLAILKENGNDQRVKICIRDIEAIWEKFLKIINKTPSYDSSLDVVKLNTKLLKSCHQLVLAIESSSKYSSKFFYDNNQDLVEIINRSGKQRMLSQRLCLYYTAIQMFPKEKQEYVDVLENIFAEFNDTIGFLLINSYNTTETEEELGGIMGLWEIFKNNKNDFFNSKFELVEVFNTTNQLTKSFNKITGIYENIAKNK